MTYTAPTDYPIHDVLAERRSPYSFDGRPVGSEQLRPLFEAARWAASSFNEQPWRFLLAPRENKAEFERMLTCLMEPNRAWASNAGALALAVAGMRFARNGKPNRCAAHDVGAASAQLVFEATARGLQVHQMAGILADRAKDVYGVPEGFDVLTGIAVGYPAAEPLEAFAEREARPRTRKPQAEFLFGGHWGETF